MTPWGQLLFFPVIMGLGESAVLSYGMPGPPQGSASPSPTTHGPVVWTPHSTFAFEPHARLWGQHDDVREILCLDPSCCYHRETGLLTDSGKWTTHPDCGFISISTHHSKFNLVYSSLCLVLQDRACHCENLLVFVDGRWMHF